MVVFVLQSGVFLALVLLRSAFSATVLQDLSSESVQWKFHSQNKSVSGNAVVPGGIFTDLQKSGVLKENFFYRYNDIMYRWVSKDNWTYYTEFLGMKSLQQKRVVNLIFEGVNTVANISFNGHQLCGCKNMFTRFVFPVSQFLKDGELNRMEVKFQSTIAYAAQQDEINPTEPRKLTSDFHGEDHVNMVRTMQASFGWDWGPSMPSQGLWKNVYLEGFDVATIRDVTYHIQLLDQNTWTVKTVVFVDKLERSDAEIAIKLQIEVDNGKTVESIEKFQLSKITTEEIEISLKVPVGIVDLWWPNGMNQSQPLYKIAVQIQDSSTHEILSSRSDKIGFRTANLVQNPVIPDEPAKGLTFFFEVNGKPIFAKGSNYIPAHVLPELNTNPCVAEHLLRSSAEAGHNILRVWGGGNYETDFFYNLCDELGIMIWQDFMFANGLYPGDDAFNEEVKNEVTVNVRRLQRHPSIVLWAGNNENEGAVAQNWWGRGGNITQIFNDYKKLYGHVIRDTVLREDPLRPYVTSSPTNGLRTDQDGFLPQNVSAWSPLYGDTHVYMYGYVNVLDSRPYNVFRFVSEFGFQSLPFLRVWKKDAKKNDFKDGLDSKFAKFRQHQPSGNSRVFGQIKAVFLPYERENEFRANENKLEDLIFLSQITQAIGTRVEAESHRRNRNYFNASTGAGYTMGSMYWQLNDIWAAPSWGGIDSEGTWKMVHYHMAEVYAPLAVSVDLDWKNPTPDHVKIFAMNDFLTDMQDIKLEAKMFDWSSLEPIAVKSVPIGRLANLSAQQIYDGDLAAFFKTDAIDYNNSFTTYQLKDESNHPLTTLQLTPLQKYKNVDFSIRPTLKILDIKRNVHTTSYPQRYLTVYDVKISTNKPAPYVWLDAGGRKGRFSDNGFIFVEKVRTVQFLSLDKSDQTKELKNVITIQCLHDAMKKIK